MKAKPLPLPASCAAMLRNKTDFPVPVWPEMNVCRARATGSMASATFDERPRVAVAMMIYSEVMARGEPCVVQGRGLPWAGLTLGVSLSPSLRVGNTTLATPACGRRPLAGVIPGHDQRGPAALYNAKVWKTQKANFVIVGNCRSRNSRIVQNRTRKFRRCETFAFA